MKKKTLVERLHEEYSHVYSKKKVYKMVNFLLERMREGIASEDGLKVSGFGSFKRKGKRVLFRLSKKLISRLKLEAKRLKM
ncbi:MAG: HU family DNA-binding protein [Aquificaceae bacterium]